MGSRDVGLVTSYTLKYVGGGGIFMGHPVPIFS